MKVEERDSILKDIKEYLGGTDNIIAKLEERDESIMRELKSINEHQVEQNGNIKEALQRSVSNKTWIIAFRWIAGIGASILSIVLTRLYGLW